MYERDFLPIPGMLLENQKEVTLLALCVWGESRGESQSGREAVANVVKNRWRAQRPGWGLTWREVITKPKQFSCFNPNDPNRRLMKHLQNLDNWMSCLEAARVVYEGLVADNTLGATHYCTIDSNPRWLKGMQETVRIGNHKFFKEKSNGTDR